MCSLWIEKTVKVGYVNRRVKTDAAGAAVTTSTFLESFPPSCFPNQVQELQV